MVRMKATTFVHRIRSNRLAFWLWQHKRLPASNSIPCGTKCGNIYGAVWHQQPAPEHSMTGQNQFNENSDGKDDDDGNRSRENETKNKRKKIKEVVELSGEWKRFRLSICWWTNEHIYVWFGWPYATLHIGSLLAITAITCLPCSIIVCFTLSKYHCTTDTFLVQSIELFGGCLLWLTMLLWSLIDCVNDRFSNKNEYQAFHGAHGSSGHMDIYV